MNRNDLERETGKGEKTETKEKQKRTRGKRPKHFFQKKRSVVTELDNTRWNKRSTWMLCNVVSFVMSRYRTAIRACCDHKSREYALSLCDVTFRDTLCAPRASFQNRPSQPTRCMSQTLRQRVRAPITKRSLALNVRAQQTFVAKVTVCRHAISQQTWDDANIKHVLPAPLLETSTFTGGISIAILCEPNDLMR